MSTTTIESVLLLVAMSVAAGLLGCFVVMRRMVLAADALSHVALPGIGLALLLHYRPLVGAMAALLVGTTLIWAIERRAGLATETVTGVVFSAALAIGSVITSGDELIDALFGRPSVLTPVELALGVGAAAGVIGYLVLLRDELLIAQVSREIAVSLGIRVAWLDLGFLLAFAVTVALGLRYLGVLLMGSLVIIPAATAKRIAGNLRGMFAIATSVAAVSTLAGMWIADRLGGETGPPIVLVAASFFLLGLLKRPRT